MADTITMATSIRPAAMVDPMMPSTPTSRADTPVKKKKEEADGNGSSSNSDVAPWFIIFVHFLIDKS